MFLTQNKNIIYEGKEKFPNNPSILQKLSWLERYHNFIVENYLNDNKNHYFTKRFLFNGFE